MAVWVIMTKFVKRWEHLNGAGLDFIMGGVMQVGEAYAVGGKCSLTCTAFNMAIVIARSAFKLIKCLEGDLWAIYKGIIVLLQRGWNKIIIETDTMQVVKLLEKETEANSPYKGIIEDAKIIMRGCKCTVQHVFKKGNLCANALAKFGAEQPEDILVVNKPLVEIRRLLIVDIVSRSRETA
ncbi:uncharacterized protein LOC114255822 [Camellia sinensis]|uniref:uncharacterized protein LOC114255822 n=1 Tax=Camellia sinensis TaxID=4442 RepID=UPI001036B97B|nr:uncharacterized protein LOC114255822 [Camellia sinensis]